MKKFILFFAAIAMAVAANAQIVTSRTYVKSKTQTMWYGRIGMSINNMTGCPSDDDMTSGPKMSAGSKIGMDVDFGFHRNFGKSNAYWGMELGLGTRGTKVTLKHYDDKYTSSLSAWNVKYSPFTFGYKFAVTEDIKIDGHLGAFVSYDFSKKYKDEDGDNMIDDLDYTSVDAGLQVGLGVWWKKINIDFMYQRGFINAFDWDYYSSDTAHSSNFEIRLGYAF